VALRLAGDVAPIGSIEPALAQRMVAAGQPLRESAPDWHIVGAADVAFESMARWLHAQGLGGPWRDELLAVSDTTGRVRGKIERAAVRPLGITTHAVHLVGHTRRGAVWVQQRAANKATDPGRWDTLMGGQVAAEETLAETLSRETWEEAGLTLDQLLRVEAAGRIVIRRPVSDGYMVEHVHMFQAELPEALQPVNQDGEVQRFECLARDALWQRLRDDAFTLEAALILLHWLGGVHADR
jgi:8-oxo-dGTP pyrophosphatase MutT (NUDIX family)